MENNSDYYNVKYELTIDSDSLPENIDSIYEKFLTQEDFIHTLPLVTRFEVIDHSVMEGGRVYHKIMTAGKCLVSLQDGHRTLKILISGPVDPRVK